MPPTPSATSNGGTRSPSPASTASRLRRGEVEPTVGKYFAGGGPDLGVVIEVAGAVYGPSSVIRDSYRPVWDYTFAEPITWKLGDPITIRIIDYDWSANEVYVLHSRQGDPLAMRLLSGTIKPTKGGRTTLVFASDFTMPELTSRSKNFDVDETGSPIDFFVMIMPTVQVRFEQAVYGSFPFWNRGYGVLARSAGLPAGVARRASDRLPAVRRAARRGQPRPTACSRCRWKAGPG